MGQYEIFSNSELETIKLAKLLASISGVACNIYLRSDIGLGKTSFCRGFLRGLGYSGRVKSPSYSLVEAYVFSCLTVYHFDFYRLRNFEEVEYIGIRDYFNCCSLCLVEWPNLVENILPQEDISVLLEYHRSLFIRKITFRSYSFLGESILKKLCIYGSMHVC
ncbi:tRNA (adenosine(37)-N6)-threonylcarbamoyltransferase complex ATPase subunit type 1 TsaE [Blochmannia endosymbiont of Polyrhachis (Hedomyrma) turneri]|uniref:tRNA (adenosine(37)-N6)-threonylcarbamoyltransferase complex ATPase subunit type 1 TsaE n=1 Tax=Blochmannia endosymbiont of Polyrhachis (Hedomyrma) turneri TaxID=1505596 RepID=UPI00061A7999|nr:tRNA (adenosine(37)-N6)-threonylcarbamoyltransferase complex ATPase subunit type 1 TsaE [Blochmannia endosymbiont of Polyrhachis (Hedomyrma) turneri]AKC59664.1 putative ATPase [Blochmannia endosymbiont of Polyrhachis (Hedomyrma) turneri]